MDDQNIQPYKSSRKPKVILALIIVILGISAYGYYWFSNVVSENNKAKTVIFEAEQYQATQNKLSDEYNKCQTFISQGQGNFGSFEYCRKFIQWVDINSLLNR